MVTAITKSGGNTLSGEAYVDRTGTSWRQIDEATRAAVTDAKAARAVMLAQPSSIKRPVVRWADAVTVGFNADDWKARI